jgi:hypothetical protein
MLSIEIDVIHNIKALTERKGCEQCSLLGSNDMVYNISEFMQTAKDWVSISASNVAVCHAHDQTCRVSVAAI